MSPSLSLEMSSSCLHVGMSWRGITNIWPLLLRLLCDKQPALLTQKLLSGVTGTVSHKRCDEVLRYWIYCRYCSYQSPWNHIKMNYIQICVCICSKLHTLRNSLNISPISQESRKTNSWICPLIQICSKMLMGSSLTQNASFHQVLWESVQYLFVLSCKQTNKQTI